MMTSEQNRKNLYEQVSSFAVMHSNYLEKGSLLRAKLCNIHFEIDDHGCFQLHCDPIFNLLKSVYQDTQHNNLEVKNINDLYLEILYSYDDLSQNIKKYLLPVNSLFCFINFGKLTKEFIEYFDILNHPGIKLSVEDNLTFWLQEKEDYKIDKLSFYLRIRDFIMRDKFIEPEIDLMFSKDHQYFIDLASSRLKMSNNIKPSVKSLDIGIFAKAECRENNLLQGKKHNLPWSRKKVTEQIFDLLSVCQGHNLSVDQIRRGLGLINNQSAAAGVGNLEHKGYAIKTKQGNKKYWQIDQKTALDAYENYCHQPDKKYPPHIITRSQIKAIRARARDPKYQQMFNS